MELNKPFSGNDIITEPSLFLYQETGHEPLSPHRRMDVCGARQFYACHERGRQPAYRNLQMAEQAAYPQSQTPGETGIAGAEATDRR